MKEILGVIGGMGPFASELFYRMVTEKTWAEKDQDHINMMILSDAGMPDRTSAILSGDGVAVCERMLADARILEENGCKGIVITCNTAHYFADVIEAELGIPILHMVRETAKEAARSCKNQKAAILATDGTIQTELYQKELRKQGVIPYLPSTESQKKIMYLIYDCIKKGRPADMEAWGSVEKELREGGCQKAILACTELSCIREQENLSEYYIDPMEVLAIRAIEFMGKKIRGALTVK